MTSTELSTKQAARRQSLLSAALALLQVRDYDRISVREVADSASVALATLYRYFPSKEHLFAEALVQWASTLGSDVTRRPLLGTTPSERLEEAYLRSLRAFERRPQLARLINVFEVSDEPFARDALARLGTATNDVFRSILSDFSDEEATHIVRILDAVLDSALRSWSSGRTSMAAARRSLSEAVRFVVEPRHASALDRQADQVGAG